MEAQLNNLTIDTAGTDEEAEEGLAMALKMEVEEDREIEKEYKGGGAQRALGDLEFLTQEAETSGTTLVDARKGFNKLSRLAILWNVRHRWPAGERFAFNYYRHWAQHILHQLGKPPVKILSKEGITQGDPISMVLYGINLVPLAEWLRAADLGILPPFYGDDAAFDGSERRSA